MDFIMVPSIIGIITYGIYKLFELFAKRKERLLMIEKYCNNTDIESKPSFSLDIKTSNTFGALKIACLLIGVGLGLLSGFFINTIMNVSMGDYHLREIAGVVYGASLFLFGGIGLLAAFIMEMKFSKKKNN